MIVIKMYDHILLLIAMIFAISGCQSKNIVDQSFISQTPCRSPCWYGLELNKSNRQEVHNVLGILPFVKSSSVKDYDISFQYGNDSHSITYDCVYKVDTNNCGMLLIVNGKLISDWYGLGYDLRIKEVTNIYGPPDFLDYNSPLSETGGCDLAFYWPEHELRIGYGSLSNTQPCDLIKKIGKVDPDQKLTYIEFSTRDRLLLSRSAWTKITWPGFTDSK
jgi:hypothetical protein